MLGRPLNPVDYVGLKLVFGKLPEVLSVFFQNLRVPFFKFRIEVLHDGRIVVEPFIAIEEAILWRGQQQVQRPAGKAQLDPFFAAYLAFTTGFIKMEAL